ncbi:MAG TPA: M1 family metallopeptidase, partial [Gemmatimonadaceae bacterium]|nr:M1 family metallopeptidase [Gemmatimonadaceae bacterium]
MLALLALSLLLQQPSVQLPAARVPTGDGLTSPPSGDTAGYWQQRVHYRISATLDERAQLLHATATLAYVNESPDTLREMYVHQYLNAFRPGSRWSADDAREGRVRFQTLKDPDYAHERFTAPVTVDGTPVRVEYPGAPDSTVARFDLPRPLLPGDSVVVAFAWDARLSTLPRRQGRRGRHWDFAQWYPKVAVYDRGGWEANPLRPAGEFYGEFGSYDVSLTVAADQVMGATGVPVAGDPGWERARRGGEVHLMRDAYGDAGVVPQSDGASATKTVRWLARDVHHFAWTTSPDYRYEGALYDGRVGIHVLYRPGDEREWGNGEAVRRTERALAWLESIYGRYPYPQVTNVHRIEGGGTEFPMMVMDGSASQGLILHEVGHIYSYGILANNEWRSGWMDEGLTSYQTSWAQGATPQELARGVVPIGDGDASAMLRPVPRQGYAARALRPDAGDLGDISQFRLDFLGRAEPVGTTAHEFGEFVIYNLMIYSRAEMMYGQLRDAVGDTAFRAFLRGYYDRWKLKHVDERAMRRSAEEASGDSLGWFFRQWVHGTGLIDYALRDVKTRREGDEWVTRARVVRRGEYRHPMPVGARAGGAWTIARADASRDDQWVELRTAAEPEEVRLDPLRTTTDWDRRNDVRPSLLDFRRVRYTFDWPFLDQSLRDRQVEALGPIGWYSTPGGAAVGVRTRSNYMGIVDRGEAGIVVSVRGPEGVDDDGLAGALGGRVGVWTVVEDPRIGRRPIMGLRLGAWALDGVGKLEVRKRWDASRFLFARAPRITHSLALTATFPRGDAWVDSLRWQ